MNSAIRIAGGLSLMPAVMPLGLRARIAPIAGQEKEHRFGD